jgi:hypothetical protein
LRLNKAAEKNKVFKAIVYKQKDLSYFKEREKIIFGEILAHYFLKQHSGIRNSSFLQTFAEALK